MQENYDLQDIQYDVIPLPSRGLFYPNKKDSLKVAYMTASDENILTSPNLLESGKMIDVLLSRKILDKDININSLLPGDKTAVLFWLRSTGYGELYPVTLKDPKTGNSFDYEIDLSILKSREIKITPDDKGECEYTLTLKDNSNVNIKFKYLTSEEDQKIVEEDEARRNRMGKGAFSEVLTKRLAAQITEINGDRDKSKIITFVERMSPKNASELRKFIADNEPGLDMQISVKAPSGEFFFTELPITSKFLWPYLES